jgi:hypothetical protein
MATREELEANRPNIEAALTDAQEKQRAYWDAMSVLECALGYAEIDGNEDLENATVDGVIEEYGSASLQYQCPVCECETTLEVSVTCWAQLNQEDKDNIQTDTTEADDGSHEWDQNSLMACKGCGHVAPAKEFRQSEEEEDEDSELCECGREWEDCATREEGVENHADRQ